MSKEFENAVLQKLDATDRVIQEVVLKKLDATDRVIQEVVLKKLEKLDVLEERTDNTDKVIQEVVLKKLDELETGLKETKEVVKNLNNNFTKFDYEINIKIDTLFDAITTNNEKHEFYEENIASLNAKTFNQDIRISNLEDKVLIA